MNIKLEKDMSVGGAVRSAGAVLAVGTDIPAWQAEKALKLGLASEEKPAPKKKAKK